jgi:hypothetical protein
MRHFYKNVLSTLIFWLFMWQSMSLLYGGSAKNTLEAEEGEGSEGQHYGDFLNLVKRQIIESDDSVETGRSAKGIFNTTLAFTIPLFSFTLPDRASAGKDYTKEAALSLFGLALVGGLAVIPYVWSASQGNLKKNWTISGRENEDVTPTFLSNALSLASRAGLDSQECMLRSVCEANQHPERFSTFLVLPVHLLTMQMRARSGEPPSEVQNAASYGQSKADACERKYRCAFSLIGAANFLISYIYPQAAPMPTSVPAYSPASSIAHAHSPTSPSAPSPADSPTSTSMPADSLSQNLIK